MPDQGSTSNRPDPAPNVLEREESQLWRWALGLLVLLATAVAALSWEQLKDLDRKSTRLNSSHVFISYAVFCLKKSLKGHVKLKVRPTDGLNQVVSCVVCRN